MLSRQKWSTIFCKSVFVKVFVLVFANLIGRSTSLFAQLPAGFSKNTVQENYTGSVGILFSDDGNQFFVWEKSGRIWVSTWNGSSYVRQGSPVLDIGDEVVEWKDRGMHSICFDPNFATNGLVYLFYQVDLHHLLYYGTPQYNPSANLYEHATISRVTRYRLQNTGGTLTTDYTSRKVLLGESITTGVPVTFESHAGGTLLFGRDGTLLLSTGDGAHHEGVDVGNRNDTYFQEALDYGMMRPNENVGAMRSQLVNSMSGKILRFDPNTGDGVPSNPFYDAAEPRAAHSRVWTMGLRNPYRMSLKPNTGSTDPADANPGTLLIGDVGWYSAEDFNVVDKAGLNCGWPVFEGMDPTVSYNGTFVHNLDEPGQPTFESLCVQPTSFIDSPVPALRRFTHKRPALDYSHGPVALTRVPAFNGTTPIGRTIGTIGAPAGTPFFGYCVIGGVYYTGSQFPASYANSYFIIDHSLGAIRNLELHDEGDHIVHEVREFAPDNFDPGIVDMKINPRDGSLYYVRVQGSIERISYGGNQPPVANASSDKTYGPSPLSVQFTGETSIDPEGQSVTYLWDFGDGTTSTAANPTHVFSNTAIHKFTVTLVVTDNQNQVSLPKEIVISVNNTPPTVQITHPDPGTLYSMSAPTSYTLQAAVTDTDLSNLTYQWQVLLHHNNHTHPDPYLTEANPVILLSPIGCSPNETYSYVISLKVTDNGGLTATHSIELFPDCNSASALVSNLTATNQVNAVQLNWINPFVTFDEVLIAAKEETGFLNIPAGTSYTANASFTGDGTPIEGGKVVYRGTGTNVTITELNPLIQYYFRVYTRVGSIWNGGVEIGAIPNLPPTAPTMTLPAAAIGEVFSYTVPAFSDPEGQLLTYTITGLPAWLSFDPVTRVLAGIPTQSGSYTLTAKATDPGSLTASVTSLLVAGPNQSPVPPVLTAQFAELNSPFSYTVPAFTDPEGKSLTYSVTGLPGWLSFNTTTRVLSGTPTQPASYTLAVKATDPASLTASVSLVINAGVCTMATVKAGSWNDPTTWSCNRVPTSNDAVQINHLISVPDAYIALARKVTFSAGTSLTMGTQAQLHLSQ